MILVDDVKLEYLLNLMQDDIVDGKEPLIVSLVHTIHQDLSLMHQRLSTLADLEKATQADVGAAREYFKDTKNLKLALAQHSQYIE